MEPRSKLFYKSTEPTGFLLTSRSVCLKGELSDNYTLLIGAKF